MPKGNFLSDLEKGKITFLVQQGLSRRQIAAEIGRSTRVVQNYITKGENYGKRSKTKGNTKISNRQKNQLLALASKGKHTGNEMIAELCLPIKKREACTILKKSGHFKFVKRKKIPSLKPTHIAARKAWAKEHVPWTTEWTRVVFSDEKKFNLDGPDGFQHYWHDLRKEPQYCTKRNFGGGSLMLWGAFSLQGKTYLCKCDGRMNSEKYLDMLEDVLIPYSENEMENDLIFQQDNAAIHVSRKSRAWFEEKDIELLKWPACSPDLNPMENLWGILARAVYANKPPYKTVPDLFVAVCNAWREIPQKILDSLVNSMQKRVIEVIECQGKQLKNY